MRPAYSRRSSKEPLTRNTSTHSPGRNVKRCGRIPLRTVRPKSVFHVCDFPAFRFPNTPTSRRSGVLLTSRCMMRAHAKFFIYLLLLGGLQCALLFGGEEINRRKR